MLNINKVESLIKEHGWNNSYFSKLMGRSPIWISDWKRGHLPDDKMIPIIAEKLDTTVEYLTDQTEDKNKPDSERKIRFTEEEVDFIENYYRHMTPEERDAWKLIIAKGKPRP